MHVHVFKFGGLFICRPYLKRLRLAFVCMAVLTLSVGADRPQEWWKPARLTVQDGRKRVTQHSSRGLSREEQYDSPATERSAKCICVLNNFEIMVTAMLKQHSFGKAPCFLLTWPLCKFFVSMHACIAASLINYSTGHCIYQYHVY